MVSVIAFRAQHPARDSKRHTMDLGLSGKTAIICAASKGLGRGCALALAREGVHVVITARGTEALEATAAEIRAATGAKVTAVAGDITTGAGRRAVLEACPAPDILINNAGGPPPGDFKDFSLDQWRAAVEGNMLTPIALIHATVYGMMERGFGRIVNITSSSIKNPIASLELSNGARLGLTGAVAVLARKAAARNVTINGILPGPFDTDRLRNTSRAMAEKTGRPLSDIDRERKAQIPSGRFGNTDEFGATVAFLSSAHAGFITGQNLLIDGGGYPGPL
jgi:3-oxoacyl-[acyl-carrier protein] reductase